MKIKLSGFYLVTKGSILLSRNIPLTNKHKAQRFFKYSERSCSNNFEVTFYKKKTCHSSVTVCLLGRFSVLFAVIVEITQLNTRSLFIFRYRKRRKSSNHYPASALTKSWKFDGIALLFQFELYGDSFSYFIELQITINGLTWKLVKLKLNISQVAAPFRFAARVSAQTGCFHQCQLNM